jgi:hypothetical protein
VSEAVLHKPIPGWVNRMANIGKFVMEIQDFIGMKPYDLKYEVNAAELGVVTKNTNPFEGSEGVVIG